MECVFKILSLIPRIVRGWEGEQLGGCCANLGHGGLDKAVVVKVDGHSRIWKFLQDGTKNLCC